MMTISAIRIMIARRITIKVVMRTTKMLLKLYNNEMKAGHGKMDADEDFSEGWNIGSDAHTSAELARQLTWRLRDCSGSGLDFTSLGGYLLHRIVMYLWVYVSV